MEWLGILFLYLISGYMKKRNQDAKRRDIESDPDWDMPQDSPAEGAQPNLDSMLSDLFGQAFKGEPEVPPVQDSVEETVESEPYNVPEHIEEHSSHIDERSEVFEENIYHSNLANRKELHFGKKWTEKNALRSYLFNSNKSLKKAIILKEVLDKPLALRK
ncbi:MAG: hypothetical protein HOI72_00565 [Candidatus Marinimicrobia bacterium]|jgi:hypothetical protein|nr:hypothetical protein [Candidatus Neomarinimicrobiota bacterium]MBT7519143.1 hypothetical protein [Candidatus Neomarinimicrobiota bacterium]